MKSHAIIRKALAVVEPVFRLDFRDGVHGIPHWSRVWYHAGALRTHWMSIRRSWRGSRFFMTASDTTIIGILCTATARLILRWAFGIRA